MDKVKGLNKHGKKNLCTLAVCILDHFCEFHKLGQVVHVFVCFVCVSFVCCNVLN